MQKIKQMNDSGDKLWNGLKVGEINVATAREKRTERRIQVIG